MGPHLQDTLSDSASSSGSQDEEEQDEEQEDEEQEDCEPTAVQPVATCETLTMTNREHVLSAQQRRDMRRQLAQQLQDLKVQQAAQKMNFLSI